MSLARIREFPKSEVLSAAAPVSAPSVLRFFGESRALLDAAVVPGRLVRSFVDKQRFGRQVDTDSAAPVVLFPGYGSDERYMKPLQLHLQNLGYPVQDWGLGLNMAGENIEHTLDDLLDHWDFDFPAGYDKDNYKGEGGVAYLIDRAAENVSACYERYQRPIALIGWSLGGYIAREVARLLGEKVCHIITFGSPVIGGPKYTAGGKLIAAKGTDIDWIEQQVAKTDQLEIKQPITLIFSKSDAVVDWRAAVDKTNPNVEHWLIDCAHLGMGFNPKIWRLVSESLQRHAAL